MLQDDQQEIQMGKFQTLCSLCGSDKGVCKNIAGSNGDFVVPGKMTTDRRMKRISPRSAVMFPAYAEPGKSVSSPDPLSFSQGPQNPLEPGILNSILNELS